MAVLQGAEFYISKRAGKAITDYGMIDDADKVAVAVSGGKDSLTLLKVLRDRQTFVPIKYKLLALHVDLGYPRSYARQLARYFKKIGVAYHIEKAPELRSTPRKDINCFWCSWNRRKYLFKAADRLGFRTIALGHHKDDIAQTILLNLFFQGEISAMKPKQELFKGRITLIRPFAYVEEAMIRKFCREEKLPIDECSCPKTSVSHRTKIAGIIRELEKTCPELKTNICNSVSRIKKDYLL